jgi:hypothetical protein
MKIVRVTYTTQPSFAAQNRQNIEAVMNALQQLNNPGILYFTTCENDEKTFVHTALFKSDEEQKMLSGLESFKFFQEQLKQSQPEAAPKQEILSFVGISHPMFNF